jgi:hypothetical protein
MIPERPDHIGLIFVETFIHPLLVWFQKDQIILVSSLSRHLYILYWYDSRKIRSYWSHLCRDFITFSSCIIFVRDFIKFSSCIIIVETFIHPLLVWFQKDQIILASSLSRLYNIIMSYHPRKIRSYLVGLISVQTCKHPLLVSSQKDQILSCKSNHCRHIDTSSIVSRTLVWQ